MEYKVDYALGIYEEAVVCVRNIPCVRRCPDKGRRRSREESMQPSARERVCGFSLLGFFSVSVLDFLGFLAFW